jgi:hypothetical protein
MDDDQVIIKIRFMIWNMSLHLFRETETADRAHAVMYLLRFLFSIRGMYWMPAVFRCDRLPRDDLVSIAIMLSACQRSLGPGRPDDRVLRDVYQTMASIALSFQRVDHPVKESPQHRDRC